ncbi:MAG: sugar ABC transporter ATP-binding protein [Planctomycetales bacterium]|nr:sugar ABC transporter ATP-binding protein [Planctomycetales bacterium]
MAEPIIEIRQVTKRFPGVIALQDVTFDVETGELHSICGENGAGKSTLMKILSGVETQYEGELFVKGNLKQFTSTRDAESSEISIIHQELNLVEELSAAANIFLGREKRTALGFLDNPAMETAAAELLRQLDCDVHPGTLAGSLRVGDQQLLEIARALSLKTEILIMDEPTSALTEAEVARLYRVIERLRANGVTILYISHKMDEVFRLSDRITVLRDGRVVQTLKKADTSPQQITHLMVGREIERLDQSVPTATGEVVLKVEDLSLPWPGHARKWRLHNINFELRRGEILGIAGLMGAGRTELLECLFGASSEVPQGKILLEGIQVLFSHPSQAKAAGIAMVTEDRKRLGIFSELDVGQNISMCTLEQMRKGGLINSRRERESVSEIVNNLRVKTASAQSAITSLSGGNQQKTIIGRWLLTKPKVLLLDDPTRGVDVGAKAELYVLMKQLARQGMAVMVTSSELPELLTVSDRILVLSEGHLTGSFSRAEATEQKIMEAATLG